MPSVYSADNVFDAHLCVMFLAEHDIEARINNLMLGQARGELPLGEATAPQVWVSDDNSEAARALMDEFQHRIAQRTGDETLWVCQACGEQNPEDFELCWNCQESRGDAPSTPAAGDAQGA